MTTGVEGVTSPSSSAAAIVMIFEVEPGSNTSVKATLLSRVPFLPMSVLGSNEGYEATASRLPVLTSSMTTVPLLALVSLIRCARAFWAYHCRLELTVRVTSLPSTAGTSELLGDRDDRAVAPQLEGLPSRGADQVLLHHHLDATAGLAGTGHEADQRGRGAALRVGALGAGLPAVAVDTGDPEARRSCSRSAG